MVDTSVQIRYETMTPRTAWLLFASSFTFLLINLIIGAAANIPFERKKCIETWHCENEHQWEFDPAVCKGLDMRKPNTTWAGSLTDLSTLHQYVYLEMTAMNRAPFGINSLVPISVTLEGSGEKLTGFGSKEADDGKRTNILTKSRHDRRFHCAEGVDWDHPDACWGCEKMQKKRAENRVKCDPVRVFHDAFIHYSEYHVKVTLEPCFEGDTDCADPKNYKMHHGDANEKCYGDIENPLDFIGNVEFCLVMLNPEITNLELSMRYIFCFFTLVVMVWYFHQMSKLPKSERSYEQYWVGLLLVSVLGLDDPFFAIDIAAPGFFFSFLNNVFMGTFFALLLLWWLIIFDGILQSVTNITRQGTKSQRFLEFYVPKLALIFTLWIVSIVVFTWVRVNEKDDPAFNKYDDYQNFSVAKWLLLVLFTIAFLWLFILVTRALGELRRMAFRFKFMFLLTLFMAVCSFAGFMIGALGPIQHNAIEFIGYFALFNVYIWLLAFCFSPDPQAAQRATEEATEGTLNDEGALEQTRNSYGTSV